MIPRSPRFDIRSGQVPAWAAGLIGFFLLLLRAEPRLVKPDVWSEDGVVNLPGFMKNGVLDLIQPVNGYMILVSKLITFISASISFVDYPRISIYLTWAFTVFVFTVIAKAPLRLKGGIFLAAACMLIPSNPECFGLPLYAFWWSSLLLFVLVFWDENHPALGFRCLILFFASLSSPVCLVTLPLLMGRAILYRKNTAEAKVAAFAAVCAALQLWSMWPMSQNGGNLHLHSLRHTVTIFLGGYTVYNLLPACTRFFGNFLFASLAVAVWVNRRSLPLLTLAGLWWAGALMTITRVDINIINPVSAGPRYFFFAYILLSWLLLQLVLGEGNRWIRGMAVGFLALGLVNAYPVLGRNHDSLDWQGHVYTCAQFDTYHIPVHFDGDASLAWSMTLKGPVCADLLRRDPFAHPEGAKTYPYDMVRYPGPSPEDIHTPGVSAVRQKEWKGLGDASDKAGEGLPKGYQVIGTSFGPAPKPGSLTVHIHRGQQILFRSEPKSNPVRIVIVGRENQFYDAAPKGHEWLVLDFSNRLLGEEFDVRFDDTGDQPGDWSAIALK